MAALVAKPDELINIEETSDTGNRVILKKLIIQIVKLSVICGVVYFTTMSLVWELTGSFIDGAILGLIAAATALVASVYYSRQGVGIADLLGMEKDDDGALYAQAEEEYDSSDIDKGLWSLALVKAKGDENLRKVEYMNLRATQLRKKSN